MLTCMKHSTSSKKLAACVNDLTVRSSIHVVCQWSYDAFLCFFYILPSNLQEEPAEMGEIVIVNMLL